MNFFKKKTGREDNAYDDEAFYDDEYYGTTKEGTSDWNEEPEAPAPAAGVSFAGAASSPVALKVIKPKSYDDGPEIADYIAGGSTVLLNIELLDKNSTKRLLDFLLGAVHVLGGSMNMVARGTFVFAPRSVGVSDLTEGVAAAAEEFDEPDSVTAEEIAE